MEEYHQEQSLSTHIDWHRYFRLSTTRVAQRKRTKQRTQPKLRRSISSVEVASGLIISCFIKPDLFQARSKLSRLQRCLDWPPLPELSMTCKDLAPLTNFLRIFVSFPRADVHSDFLLFYGQPF